MPTITYNRFVKFLQEEINLPQDSIAIAQRSVNQNLGLMPMVLWQYGLVTIEQLDRIYDWLETC
ncbi:hypothetical protein GM3708_2837 [Geminocystis sp. NIES-3708]|uniref:DUF2949 domain-containing protein n=1 Tax=Geminocystis sp. NIES-3708 TaxID=1615909 RepID=UPI0005FC7CAE|nr:DUF2949 domain-containing protein [Geminocystis sp. NIES-3708]BAQ62431.1 hypothetical protein GM3708_2837 [Geminocystis sp. NIES-3708]